MTGILKNIAKKADSDLEFVEDFREEKTKINYLAGMDARDFCKMKYYFPGVLRTVFFFFASLIHSPVILKGAHESMQYS